MPDETTNMDECPPLCGGRLIRVMLLETLLVTLVCLGIVGLAWEVGYFTFGVVIAALIWICVSPLLEIATVRSARRQH